MVAKVSEFVYPGSDRNHNEVIIAGSFSEAGETAENLLEGENGFSILDEPSLGATTYPESEEAVVYIESPSGDLTGRDIEVEKLLQNIEEFPDLSLSEVSIVHKFPTYPVRASMVTESHLKNFLDAQFQRASYYGVATTYVGVDRGLEKVAETSNYDVEVRTMDSVLQ
ncbi:MAG: hypothetical protein ACI8Z7_000518 [Candidatus Nanohaloarchaea archaeon]|jgi:hypothetical protein